MRRFVGLILVAWWVGTTGAQLGCMRGAGTRCERVCRREADCADKLELPDARTVRTAWTIAYHSGTSRVVAGFEDGSLYMWNLHANTKVNPADNAPALKGVNVSVAVPVFVTVKVRLTA